MFTVQNLKGSTELLNLFSDRIFLFERLDSTNQYLLDHSFKKPALCMTNEQTAGRGRRQSHWTTTPGASLALSVSCSVPADAELEKISLYTGLAICRVLQQSGVETIGIKWPNDILLDGKKLAGILVEMQSTQDRLIVIGVGMNLHAQSVENMEYATCLPTHVQSDVDAIVVQIIKSITHMCAQIAAGNTKKLLDDWSNYDFLNGRQLQVAMESGKTLIGHYSGIDPQTGFLLLRDEQSRVHALASGHVSIRNFYSEC